MRGVGLRRYDGAVKPRLILCDFDGTVTERDTNSYLASRFAPAEYAQLEGKLGARELTLRDVLARQHGAIKADLPDVVAAICTIPLRDGFAELLAEAGERGDRFVLLSSGFRSLIEPMLSHAGHRDIELVSNDVEYVNGAGQVTWRELPVCEICGEECKRHDVARLAGGGSDAGVHGSEAGVYREIVFIGDGFSDRCGAEAADRIFALEGAALQHDLETRGRAFETFTTLHDVADALRD